MNKFELNEIKAKALTSVAGSVQYNIDYCLTNIEEYQHKVQECTPEGEKPDPDSYWAQQVRQSQAQLDLWNEFAALLEKKLSK